MLQQLRDISKTSLKIMLKCVDTLVMAFKLHSSYDSCTDWQTAHAHQLWLIGSR